MIETEAKIVAPKISKPTCGDPKSRKQHRSFGPVRASKEEKPVIREIRAANNIIFSSYAVKGRKMKHIAKERKDIAVTYEKTKVLTRGSVMGHPGFIMVSQQLKLDSLQLQA